MREFVEAILQVPEILISSKASNWTGLQEPKQEELSLFYNPYNGNAKTSTCFPNENWANVTMTGTTSTLAIVNAVWWLLASCYYNALF